MGSFNPISFIINTNIQGTFPLYNETSGASANKADANQTNLTPNSNPKTMAQPNGTSQTLQPSKPLSNINQILISTVEVEQRANYIKDLLNLPRDFQTLISQIQEQNQDVQALKELSKLLQNGKIDLTALSTLLSNNSKDAVQKLMATIAAVSKMGANNVNQLKELMGLLGSSGGQYDTIQTVKNLIMLYLPYLPLSIRSELNLDFDIDIFEKIQGEDPNKEDPIETIKIMIETANFGNVLATLELGMNGEVDIFISAIESFPEQDVLKELNCETKKINTRANVTVEKSKDFEFKNKIKQNIQITSSNYVSPKLLLMAHSLIKIIIDVDNREFIINEETEG